MARLMLLLLAGFLASLINADESSAPEFSMRESDEKMMTLLKINARHIVILLQDMKTLRWEMEGMKESLQDLQAAQEEIRILQQTVNTCQQETETLQQTVNTCQQETETLQQTVNTCQQETETLQNNITTLLEEIETLKPKPASCDEAAVDGIVTVSLSPSNQPIQLYCEQHEDGAWTVILRRVDNSYNFPTQPWSQYKKGFGDLSGSFWLGLEAMHLLTNPTPVILRVDLEDWDGATRHAQYSSFSIGSESDGYRLSVSGYSGDAGDSLSYHDGMQFSSIDRDNDKWSSIHCAEYYKGAWWYKGCSYSCLTGEYLRGQHSKSTQGLFWHHWRGPDYSYKSAKMMLRHP